ncbi:MAG: hypothetical protein M1826_001296 [Phylliscum demangeonii]|nr:MAG: hypothetical protein M1826_001296 [Phylliscum demangeonii]
MRNARVFGGSSHPALTASICAKIGISAALCTLGKYANGEISVHIGCSIRDQDVFVVQSGGSRINDSIMELLIMISACKGGSANKITAVLPYFPYSRQSKKKSCRGAITARMLANLLSVAGVHHIITVDLHASQMQGFFRMPVDNLHAEPIFARWIQRYVANWQEAVVVSKNPGGTKRVTSLADVLKLNFGLVATDKRRSHMGGSVSAVGSNGRSESRDGVSSQSAEEDPTVVSEGSSPSTQQQLPQPEQRPNGTHPLSSARAGHQPLTRTRTRSAGSEDFEDGRARDVITGRLVRGHLVDDDFPSPTASLSASISTLVAEREGMQAQSQAAVLSASSALADSAPFWPYSANANQMSEAAAGYDEGGTSDEEEEAQREAVPEQTITLIGNVKGKTVFIVDDMIDKARSWIAAAETVVKRGGAKRVYCIATHGLFGNDSLKEMAACDCIDHIVVTNSCPIDPDQARTTKKLVVLDISNLMSEAIRRNHFGESVSQLYQLYDD